MTTVETNTVLWWLQLITSKNTQLYRYLCAPLVTSIYLCYTQLTNNLITTLPDQFKAPICANKFTIQPPTVRPGASTLWKSCFLSYCTQTSWIQYGYKQGDQKPVLMMLFLIKTSLLRLWIILLVCSALN